MAARLAGGSWYRDLVGLMATLFLGMIEPGQMWKA